MPALIEAGRNRRQPQIWSVGSVADAVAVVAAYRHACGDGSDGVQAFASAPTRALSPVQFSLSDIRCVPAGTRDKTFERHQRSWVPGAEISQQVLLAEPTGLVDLVTLRPDATEELAGHAIERLREGGRLLLLDPAVPVARHRGLRSLDPSRRIFRKCTRSSRAPTHRPDAEPATLAHHQAQSDLVAGHARLARSLARRFSHHGESKEDLEQVALMALVKAARRYDPSREISFSTYATASILGEIKRHFRDKTWVMRVPRSIQEHYLAVKEAREALTHELSASPTIQQIAERLGVSDELVLEAMEAGENYWPESLDIGVFEGESGRDVPVMEDGFDSALERHHFASLLPRLAPRERLILKRIYIDGWTQRQVADEIGVSQMQVSRVLGRTIENLRAWAGESGG